MRRTRLAALALPLAAAAGLALAPAGVTPKPATPARAIAIRHVRLFDGNSVIADTTVVIAEGLIAAAGPDAKIPEGAAVVEGAGKTLLPGFIDAHAHVFPGSLVRALRFGVTTELDMFTVVGLMRSLKAEQKAGAVTRRADLLSAGILVTVAGGHGSEYFKIPTYTPGSDPQKFIDERLAEGSDYIKLIYDDGRAYGLRRPTLTKTDLASLIAAAHNRGRMAVVHSGSLAGARDAVEAGADGLAHIFADQPPDADFARFVASHHAFVIPTLTVNESVTGAPSGESLISDANLKPYLDASEITNLKAAFRKRPGNGTSLENALQTVRELKSAGVPLLAGTDAPNPGTAHGASIHRELQLLVRAGLTPVEALAAATSVPAAAFHLKDRGRIAPGLRADLLLVNGDPTTDILATRNIVSIWKSGALLAREPETAQAQSETPLSPITILRVFRGGRTYARGARSLPQ
jgi:imidazolonepropionase-like amidohydrolase